MKILLIIPAYNEENCITKVIDELVERYPQYDYIIVNDGSTDHTSEICHKSGYEIIDLPINLGLAGAFQTGLKYAYLKNYDYAMQMDADGKAVPAIAESYELSEDGLTYTFHLREDAVWSNGEPVTAADFVFGWQRAVDPSVASEYAYMLSDIGQIKNAAEIIAGEKDKSELGVTAVDDHTLQVELNVPVSYFLSLMYASVLILHS